MSGKPDLQQILPLGLVIAAGFLLYLGLGGGDSSPKISAEKKEQVRHSANEHLRKTAEQIEMQKRQMAIRSWQLANDFNRTVPERAYTPPKEGAELVEEGIANDVARDLGRDNGGAKALPANPADLIHHQLFEEQNSRQQSAAYRKEYARQFVENARRGGWEIRLDDDYKVISVRRLRQPSNQYQLFGQ
ncbi:MAG: hypothetical protein KF865_13615 [Bdellovibrionaceae bacterium]|nr:hypothetical protein [Pseudobdellovibrionaceae bacterium]